MKNFSLVGSSRVDGRCSLCAVSSLGPPQGGVVFSLSCDPIIKAPGHKWITRANNFLRQDRSLHLRMEKAAEADVESQEGNHAYVDGCIY